MAEQVPTRLLTFGRQTVHEQVGRLEVRVEADPWYVRGQSNNPLSRAVFHEILGADVVHCHQQHILMSSLSALFARVSARRVFVTDLGGGGWDLSAYVSTDRWFHGHLHISEYSRSVFGHDGKPWARVILGGVDADKFSPESSVARAGSVLFVGRIAPHKGLADLVAALPPEIPLDIIGPRSDEAYLAALQAQAGNKTVHFRHDCDDRALVDAYRRALCVVLPSVYRAPDGRETAVPELLGQTLLEAMACGTPVICTRVASMPEIVDNGQTGFSVEPGDRAALSDRLRWFAVHPREADAMGRAGRCTVLNRFQWPQVVQRCLDAYAA
jgi:glycosyltransferase involved in cell wall biosynthesis